MERLAFTGQEKAHEKQKKLVFDLSLCYPIGAVKSNSNYARAFNLSRKEVISMKEGIHPDYKECKVTCACGNTFMTKSVNAEIRTDICSACHPFFTGQQKFAHRGGRVEKFKNKYNLD